MDCRKATYNDSRNEYEGQETFLAVSIRNAIAKRFNEHKKEEERGTEKCGNGATPFATGSCAASIFAIAHSGKLNESQLLSKQTMRLNGDNWGASGPTVLLSLMSPYASISDDTR
mgnify:CR=1 FL=1